MPVKKILQFFIALTFAVFLMETSSAQEYGVGNKLEYHGGTTHVRLGGGVNKNFPLNYKKVCVEDTTAYDPDSSATGTADSVGSDDGFGSFTTTTNGAGVPETTFDIEFIQDTEEMHNLLSISGLIAAQLKFRGRKLPGMNLDARGDKEFKLNDTTLNLVLKVKSNFGRQMIKDDSLKEEYQAMLENGEYEKFEKYCGTHYVAWQRRQGVVSAILTVSDLTEEQKQNLRASFEIGTPPESQYGDDYDDGGWGDNDDNNDNDDDWGGGDDDDWDDGWGDDWGSSSAVERDTGFNNEPLDDLVKEPKVPVDPIDPIVPSKGVGARFSINNFLKAVRKIGKKATLKFYANGGGGPQHLGKLASSFNGGKSSFQDVLEGIGHYLENFSFHSAPPVEYYLVPYFDYEKQENDIDHALLKNTYYAYVEVENSMVSIQEHLKKLSLVTDKKEVTYFREKLRQLDEIRTTLWDMGQKILEGEIYTMSDIPRIPRVNWSKFIPQVKGLKFSFNCFSKDPGTKCGAPYKLLKRPAYWQATFDLNARISVPHKVKSVTFAINGRTKKVVLGHVDNGDSIKSDDSTLEFNTYNRGKVTINAGKMTMDKYRERYVQLTQSEKNIPEGSMLITLKSGEVIEIPLGRPKMVGNHGQWKSSTFKGSQTSH